MDKNTIIVSVTVGILGLLSVLLGFAAEATRIRLSDIYLTFFGCTHPNSPAFGLAVAAALLLLVTQIILHAFMGCCGCCKTHQDLSATSNILVPQTGSKRTSAIIMICTRWATFFASFILFLTGALANTPGGQVDDKCTTVKPGFLCHRIYLLSTYSRSGNRHVFPSSQYVQWIANSAVNPGIGMGFPQQYPQQAVNGQTQFQQQGVYGYRQTAQKPGDHYRPPGTTPAGYGYNTMTNM